MDFGFDVFGPFAEWWTLDFITINFPLFGIYIDVGTIFVFCGIGFILVRVYRWLTDG